MTKEEELQQVSAFPAGEKNPYGQFFDGQSYLAMLVKGPVNVANVTFEPGCRNHWHIHHKSGQILIVTGGRVEGSGSEWCEPVSEEEYNKLK